MPRLVSNAELIIARVAHGESEFPGPPGQPSERTCAFELLSQRLATRCRNINGSSRMMLAIAGEGAHSQNLLPGLAGCQFALNELFLIIDTPERGNQL